MLILLFGCCDVKSRLLRDRFIDCACCLVLARLLITYADEIALDVFWLNFSKLYFNQAAYCGGFRGSINF